MPLQEGAHLFLRVKVSFDKHMQESGALAHWRLLQIRLVRSPHLLLQRCKERGEQSANMEFKAASLLPSLMFIHTKKNDVWGSSSESTITETHAVLVFCVSINPSMRTLDGIFF